jgi:hypothetical protein
MGNALRLQRAVRFLGNKKWMRIGGGAWGNLSSRAGGAQRLGDDIAAELGGICPSAFRLLDGTKAMAAKRVRSRAAPRRNADL